MSFLTGLNGTVAAILICILLFVDEAGIPLPIAPNEALLLLTGVLIASGAFPLWLIFPLAFLAMTAGMLVGYGWARTLGQSGLQAMAERLQAGEVYNRVQTRLKSATPLGIAIARMIPGLRPYATLVSGAAEVDLRTFLFGAVPALLLWEIIVVAVGMLVGLPVAHIFNRFEKVLVRGLILVVLGVVGWLAVRNNAAHQANGISRIAPRLRASLALAVDAAIVFSVVGGLAAVARRLIHLSANVWIEVVVGAALLALLLVLGRSIQTPGENLFDTHYWHQPSETAQEAGAK